MQNILHKRTSDSHKGDFGKVLVCAGSPGMAGAAIATIISQYIATIIVIIYLFHFKSAKLTAYTFIPRGFAVKESASLGVSSFFNQLAMMITQIIFNNSLNYYGAQSIYGDSIPIAVSGIVIKVAQLLFGIIIGIAQGLQPTQDAAFPATMGHWRA